MTKVWRQDKLQLDAQSGVDPDTGFLTGRVTLAKVGVYPYLQADGSVRHEFVPPETLADKTWLASCEMAPVTVLHPPEPVCATNADRYQVGALGEQVVAKDDRNESRLRVYRADGVEAVKAGVTEASCGYTCVLVHKPGEYQGQKYDAVQTARRMNHLAIVPRGRHGPDVRLRMDAAYPFAPEPAPEQPKELKMPAVRLGNLTLDVADASTAQAIQTHVDTLQAKADAAEAAKLAEKTRADKAEGERDAAKAAAEQAKAEVAKAAEQARADAKARMALESQVAKVLPELQTEGKTDAELRLAVLQKLDPQFKADGKSEVYVQARFDAALDLQAAGIGRPSGVDEVRRDTALPRNDGAQSDVSDWQLARALELAKARGINV